MTGGVSAHGAQNDLEGTITVRPEGDGLRVTRSEDVDFRQFGLKAPACSPSRSTRSSW